jgi:hypothetical protein
MAAASSDAVAAVGGAEGAEAVANASATPASQKRRLTEADIPGLPPRLPAGASEEDKLARNQLMAERRRLQKALNEQQRDRDRGSPADQAAQRSALRLLTAARQEALPTVRISTFDRLWALTEAVTEAGYGGVAERKLLQAWQDVLHRPLPARMAFYTDGDNTDRGSGVQHQIEACAPSESWRVVLFRPPTEERGCCYIIDEGQWDGDTHKQGSRFIFDADDLWRDEDGGIGDATLPWEERRLLDPAHNPEADKELGVKRVRVGVFDYGTRPYCRAVYDCETAREPLWVEIPLGNSVYTQKVNRACSMSDDGPARYVLETLRERDPQPQRARATEVAAWRTRGAAYTLSVTY